MPDQTDDQKDEHALSEKQQEQNHDDHNHDDHHHDDDVDDHDDEARQYDDDVMAVARLGEWLREQQTMEDALVLLQQEGWMF
jgi:hypothetical protein